MRQVPNKVSAQAAQVVTIQAMRPSGISNAAAFNTLINGVRSKFLPPIAASSEFLTPKPLCFATAIVRQPARIKNKTGNQVAFSKHSITNPFYG
jgi:hypothetical protein